MILSFYNDLGKWVESINQKANLPQQEYWDYIVTSMGVLSDKYNNNPLVKEVLLFHFNYLESQYKKS